MNEIEIGEYVRTDKGVIGKIKRIELDKNDTSLKWYLFDRKRPDMNIVDEVYINKPYIVKHSKNIIDLIEVGDYVNGYLIKAIERHFKIKPYRISALVYKYNKDTEFWTSFEESTIETIATKEQFKNIEYKVGD